MSYLFGELAILVQELEIRNNLLQKKMTAAKDAMLTIGIPLFDQNTILDYISSSDDSLYFQKQLNSFLGKLSPSLQASITKELFEGLCQDSKLLKTPIQVDPVLQRELSFIGALS